jgi:hypothetical protein
MADIPSNPNGWTGAKPSVQEPSKPQEAPDPCLEEPVAPAPPPCNPWKTVWRRWSKDQYRLVSMSGDEKKTTPKLIRGFTMYSKEQLDILAKLGCIIEMDHYRSDHEYED